MITNELIFFEWLTSIWSSDAVWLQLFLIITSQFTLYSLTLCMHILLVTNLVDIFSNYYNSRSFAYLLVAL